MDFSFLMSSLLVLIFSPLISMMPSPTITSFPWNMNIYLIILDEKGSDLVPEIASPIGLIACLYVSIIFK
jgi:hypothetical protein